VAPLLRGARDLARWAGPRRPLGDDGRLSGPDADGAAAELDISAAELDAAWDVAVGTGMLAVTAREARPGGGRDLLGSGDPDKILAVWTGALGVVLRSPELDGLATVLYTAAAPVRMDALFDAYAAAAGTLRGSGRDGAAHGGNDSSELSSALEMLADLAVVELGTEEEVGVLTVALSPLGVWGMNSRLRARGWHVPVLGGSAAGGAAALLTALAACDAEDGEAEIAAWLGARGLRQAAAELTEAASEGSPGLRGAAFAVLDRIGDNAIPVVRAALADPVLRPHAAVWLREHGEEAELDREDRAWLLVDLGAGLLEEADPADVVAELLPELPSTAQAELVASLWQVGHPGVIALLTTLSDHHSDAAVAKAARKAAFKARSRSVQRP
jgi:hypothetical protein